MSVFFSLIFAALWLGAGTMLAIEAFVPSVRRGR